MKNVGVLIIYFNLIQISDINLYGRFYFFPESRS